MNLYATGIAFNMGSLVIPLQILRRLLEKDLRRELKKVLLQYVWLLLDMSLALRAGWLVLETGWLAC
jgi:cytochrome bd-type quinol oxidase subunit 1